MEYIKSKIRDVQDFPSKGVLFKDLTTAFKDPRALHIIGWDLSQLYRDKGVTKVVGIESRGFIGGSILAFELGAGFVPARKPGKLPADTVRWNTPRSTAPTPSRYTATPSAPTTSLSSTTTCSPPAAPWPPAYELVKSMNPKKIYINFIIELEALNGRETLPAEAEVTALIKY